VSDCSTPKGYRQIFNEKMRPERRGATGERASIGLLNESLTSSRPEALRGKTLLEVGGIGAVEIDLLKAGVSRTVNVELTPTYETAASELLGPFVFAGILKIAYDLGLYAAFARRPAEAKPRH
jgi:hypothetical protein